ncbi:MAG TPA: cytotoxic translational repressor of toxin-antitoxin stability system [Verrucomicrobiae bacterium]|jgi:mRNA-degrading endonuclease RelE of RelBE toxin-antitoxin system
MSYRVQVREQVWKFYGQLGLQDRRAVKRAILELANERGDIRALRDRLDGYYRLRVGSYRVVFRYLPGRVIECVYVNDRALVYDVFESELHRIIAKEPRG